MKRIAFVLTAILMLFPLNIDAQNLNEKWRWIDGDDFAEYGLFCKDIDADGQDEIIVSNGNHLYEFFLILKYIEGDYVNVMTSRVYMDYVVDGFYKIDDLSQIELADINKDGIYEIYALLSDGRIESYNGKTYELLDTIEIEGDIFRSLAVSNIDRDDRYEYIVSGKNNDGSLFLKIVDIQSLEVEFSSDALQTTEFRIGDVDEDSNIEIVLASGQIISSPDYNIEWTFTPPASFSDMQLDNVDDDNESEIIMSRDSYKIEAYDLRTKTFIWEMETQVSPHRIRTADINDDGKVEIFIAENISGYIIGYDIESKTEVGRVFSVESRIANFALGDTDSDNKFEAVAGDNQFFVQKLGAGNPDWRTLEPDNIWFVDVCDVDKNGTLEIVALNDQFLMIFDAVTHSLQWYHTSLNYLSRWNSLVVGNINDSPQAEILIGTGGSGIYVVDGITKESQYIPGRGNNIWEIYIADFDADSQQEYLVAAEGSLICYNGSTHEQEWIIYIQPTSGHIDISNIDSDPALELIFADSDENILIYDGLTREVESITLDFGFDEITAVKASDLNNDGKIEIIAGTRYSAIKVIDYSTKTFSLEFEASEYDGNIAAIAVMNTDSEPYKEILAFDSKIKIFDSNNASLKWQSGYFGMTTIPWVSNVRATDVDNDNLTDIIFSTDNGIFHYETTIPSVDETLPVELTTFEASLRNNTAQLTWQTATETNNYGFYVERKLPTESDWGNLSFIQGKGTVTSPQFYRYSDDISRLKYQSQTISYRLKQVDMDGSFEYSHKIMVDFKPQEFRLSQNYPNPFNPTTQIEYELPEDSKVILKIYNMRGQEIRTLVNEQQSGGFKSVTWDARDSRGYKVSSGIYFYAIQMGDKRFSRKMVLIE